MKVPNHIKEKMQQILKLSQTMSKKVYEVENWLEQRGFDVSETGLRDGAGNSLEELEYGIDVVDLLCERIETEAASKNQKENKLGK